MLKENSKIKVHIYSGTEEIKTRNHGKIFDVHKKNGKFGIDWNTERIPYTCMGDTFTPFETFSHNVIFEDVETGKFYNYNNIVGGLEEV